MEEEATQAGTRPSLHYSSLRPYHIPLPLPEYVPPSMTDDPYYVATQLVIDPRRLGHGNSGLNDDDLADIVCILHPSTVPTCRAAAYIHESDPQHTIIIDSNVRIREKAADVKAYDDTDTLASQGLVACDLALRLSADLRDPLGGFHFGRNPQRCDFLIGQHEPTKRISNIHFRIYVNEYGVIMLEDQSTNGTGVNDQLLRGRDKENGVDFRHSLENGCMITLTMTPPEEDWKFIVRIPQRDSETEMAYQSKLTAFCHRRNELARQKEARAVAARGGKENPVCVKLSKFDCLLTWLARFVPRIQHSKYFGISWKIR